MTKTISINDSIWRVLKYYRNKLTAERNEKQGMNDAIDYLIKRDCGEITQQVELPENEVPE